MTFSRINRISLFIVILSFLAIHSSYAQITKTVGLLKGSVTLADGTPLANIPVTILKGNDILSTTKSSPDGKITTVLQPSATYRIRVNTIGYLYYEDTLSLGALKAYQEFPVHLTLSPLIDGQAFSLPLPVFAPRSQAILSCAQPEFDRIVDQMKHNPKLSASITVYPDAPVKTKKDAAQKTLASGREMSIRSYFMGKGISESHFSVASEIASVPPGKFQPNDPAFPPSTATAVPSKKKKKSKAAVPTTPSLVPQYIEVIAHVAS
jgi:hypothetical protein